MRGLVPRFFLTPHPGIDCADDRLPPMVHKDVLDGDFLLPLAAIMVERVEPDSIGARSPGKGNRADLPPTGFS